MTEYMDLKFNNASCKSCGKPFLALDNNDTACTRCVLHRIGYGPEPLMVVAKDTPPWPVGRPHGKKT